MLQFLALFKTHLLHVLYYPVRAEQAHQVVLQADEEMGGARVALPGAASAQLPVDTARFMPLSADHVQSTGFGNPHSEVNVRSATGHVRGNRQRGALAS